MDLYVAFIAAAGITGIALALGPSLLDWARQRRARNRDAR